MLECLPLIWIGNYSRSLKNLALTWRLLLSFPSYSVAPLNLGEERNKYEGTRYTSTWSQLLHIFIFWLTQGIQTSAEWGKPSVVYGALGEESYLVRLRYKEEEFSSLFGLTIRAETCLTPGSVVWLEKPCTGLSARVLCLCFLYITSSARI